MAEVREYPTLEAARADSEPAVRALETGGLILFPNLPFGIKAAERPLLDPAVLDASSKNVSLDPATGKLGGVSVEGERLQTLTAMVRRYSEWAEALIRQVAPSYVPALQKRRTSYRPGAIATRALSPRKDDRRLHVDAFPANPVQGRRILRVFTNINPEGVGRVWNVGEEDFPAFADRFRRHVRPSGPAAAWALQTLGITKGRRTPYDQAMLDLHDAAKLDDDYQQGAPRRRIEFPAGATWIVYTDSVLHAALQGQHCLEQTFLMPVQAMQDQSLSPLRVLETLTGRPLV